LLTRHSTYGSHCRPSARWVVRAEQKQSSSQQTKQEEDDLPPWARKEQERALAEKDGGGLPFGVYLLASAIVAIAATGSLFELANQHPIFGVIGPGNPLYTPILLFLGVTGFPSAGFLFYKAIQAANKAAERMDKVDGY
jgi:hypothetical protein